MNPRGDPDDQISTFSNGQPTKDRAEGIDVFIFKRYSRAFIDTMKNEERSQLDCKRKKTSLEKNIKGRDPVSRFP